MLIYQRGSHGLKIWGSPARLRKPPYIVHMHTTIPTVYMFHRPISQQYIKRPTAAHHSECLFALGNLHKTAPKLSSLSISNLGNRQDVLSKNIRKISGFFIPPIPPCIASYYVSSLNRKTMNGGGSHGHCCIPNAGYHTLHLAVCGSAPLSSSLYLFFVIINADIWYTNGTPK